MKAFRYYQVTTRLSNEEHSYWFEERCGSLIPGDAPIDAEQLDLVTYADDPTGSRLSVALFGHRGERRQHALDVDPVHRLTRLFLTLLDCQHGVILRGLKRSHFCRYAKELESVTCSSLLSHDQRFNLLAEGLLGPFEPLDPQARTALLGIAGLNTQISQQELQATLRNWYADAETWSTRLVGFQFNSKWFLRDENGLERSLLAKGDRCTLVRERHNRADENAVMIFHCSGHKLGYLRRNIAEYLAPLIDQGLLLKAEVCAFLPQEYRIDERVYLKLYRLG